MAGRKGEGWGTDRAGAWARGLPLGEAEEARCPDRRLRWNRRDRGETGGSCLKGEVNTKVEILPVIKFF